MLRLPLLYLGGLQVIQDCMVFLELRREGNMEHGGWNSHCEMEHGKQRGELSLCNAIWNTAGGTLIVERNMQHGGWNSHCGMELGTRRVEFSFWNGTWNKLGEFPILERIMQHGG